MRSIPFPTSLQTKLFFLKNVPILSCILTASLDLEDSEESSFLLREISACTIPELKFYFINLEVAQALLTPVEL